VKKVSPVNGRWKNSVGTLHNNAKGLGKRERGQWGGGSAAFQTSASLRTTRRKGNGGRHAVLPRSGGRAKFVQGTQ